MASTAKDTAQELVTIEVDGRQITARKGQMLIEATDAHDIYIPRFCYHPELSVAANCRMCLVEVERAPKPLPACATPVADGMKVRTRSALALDAQRATMEFLLINHPLDCPICDQGGECELQDLAMGFGSDVSRYSERKRVVADPDIGPLIQTDLTRCIHCTRCVRFGEEVAGMKELGATGRGEHMTIGTYVGRAVTSELSGNVIDLCPVGALTSKPFRFSARPWELRARPALAVHDCVGSNCEVHVKGDTVKRVVPRENPDVNLTWLSDRDRFSYEGLYAADRLLEPMIKERGEWRPAEWEEALDLAADALRRVVDEEGPEALGVLASPSATVEELYALARLARGLGCENIDHRLQQVDFRGQQHAPLAPVLGQGWGELEQADAILLVGSWARSEQPLANLRLRRAAQAGARVMVVNPAAFAWNWKPAVERVVRPSRMPAELGAIAAALGVAVEGAAADDAHRAIAEALSGAERPAVLLGELAMAHPDYSVIAGLARAIAQASGARMGSLPAGANAVGAWLAGALPHRAAAGEAVGAPGLDAAAMMRDPRRAYLLYGVEPLYDCRDGALAQRAVEMAELVVAFTAFRSPELEAAADVLLPIALFAENEGTLVNAEGRWQSMPAAVRPPGDVRRGWRVLRVLGNRLGLDGFEWFECEEVRGELAGRTTPAMTADGAGAWPLPATVAPGQEGMERLTVMPMNRVDALVRRAPALQRTVHTPDCRAHLSPADAARLGVADAEPVVLTQGDQRVELALAIDERVPEGVVLLWAGEPTVAAFGRASGPIEVGRAS